MEAAAIVTSSAFCTDTFSETYESSDYGYDADSFNKLSYHEQMRKTMNNEIIFSALEKKT